jgi:hypothetical protein
MILSGQQDQAGLDRVQSNIGKAPAVGAYDLMEYSPSRVERGSTARPQRTRLYNDPYVLTRDELGDFKHYGAASPGAGDSTPG